MRIVVNHLTRMGAPRICVAGVDPSARRHVRPTTPATDPITRTLLEENGGPFGIGAVVELGDVRPQPVPPESEDHVFATTAASRQGRLTGDEYAHMLDGIAHDDLEAIFGAALERRGRSFAVDEGSGAASLGVLRVQEPTDLEIDNWGKLRLVLDDVSQPARLGVTDIRFVEADHKTLKADVVDDYQRRLRRGVGGFMMVGLARAWRAAGDDHARHWLQVNGICLVDRPLG